MPAGVEFKRTNTRKRAIVWWLIHNGDVTDPSGGATRVLAESIAPVEPTFRRLGIGAMSSLLLEMERDDQLISRLVNGKRTTMIGAAISAADLANHPRYGDDPWQAIHARVSPPPPETPETPPGGPETPPGDQGAPDAPPAPETPPETDWRDDLAQRVDEYWAPPPMPPDADPHALLAQAMAFISQAIATSRPVDQTDPQVLTRLADALEENQRLRRRVDALEDDNRANREEMTALRAAKFALEANLQTIANGRLDEAGLRRFRELDRLVRSAPTAKRHG